MIKRALSTAIVFFLDAFRISKIHNAFRFHRISVFLPLVSSFGLIQCILLRLPPIALKVLFSPRNSPLNIPQSMDFEASTLSVRHPTLPLNVVGCMRTGLCTVKHFEKNVSVAMLC